MAEKKEALPEGVREYELKEGTHGYFDPREPDVRRKVASPGDMVPLTQQQFAAFGDRFIDPDAKKAPKSNNPAQAKAAEDDGKVAEKQNALHVAKDFQDPTEPVKMPPSTVVGVTETSVGKDADGTPISAGQVTANAAEARATELESKGLLDPKKGPVTSEGKASAEKK